MAGAARLNARALAGVLALAFLVSACASRPPHWAQAPVNPGPGAPSGEYTVRAGDTLYSIAFRHGLDWRDVARWNGVEGPGYLIRVGQRLRLSGAASTAPTTAAVRTPAPVTRESPVRSDITFRWPARGEVVPGDGKGIAIHGKVGDDVVAAAAGRVVYTGSGLIGYGRLIIVKHDSRLLSAYAHNDEILVREGEEVSAGQRIARMGEGPGRRAMLHFEIRIDGQAVDPMRHLPPR